VTACVVGVDGGGSTTRARVSGLDGATLGEGSASGSNWESVGVERAVEAIRDAVRAALAAAGRGAADVVASAFGLAGVDWPSDASMLDDALAALGLGGVRWVDNDVMVALRATCGTRAGVVSNVGTGAVTAGRGAGGATLRSMAVGWGEPSGASGLVRDALHAVAAAHHGTAPWTVLTEAVLAASGAPDVASLFERVSRQRLRPTAAWAPLVTRAASEGDDVARRLLAASGERHGAMVVGIATKLGIVHDDVPVAMSGSVHHAGDAWFAPAFAATVAAGCPRATLSLADAPPVHGAVLIALDLVGA